MSTIILWLSLCVILVQFWRCNFFSSVNAIHNNSVSISNEPFSNRKMLATKFDFTPFLKSHYQHHHHHSRHLPLHREPAGSDIDQRYGADKRLVPSGPNPLHH
ncbi:hypothetical protein K2173_003884 [Erythroxylum novogranatense]|uniref:Uncharacterized protein n=1 Tax=Erythroxylum novogranatense TaxID=1862640 RepID=A0AAV8SJ52_9ROSI|nr:hypothetical protein K2173_003884 [Erythroxylum novogranatense]